MTIGLRDIYGVSANDLLPTGGTTGQVLAKQSATNGDVDWEDVSGGIVPDPAAGVSQTITAADPGDTPFELLPAAGQTEPLLKANGIGAISKDGYLLGRSDATTPATGEIGEVIPGNDITYTTPGKKTENFLLPKGVFLVQINVLAKGAINYNPFAIIFSLHDSNQQIANVQKNVKNLDTVEFTAAANATQYWISDGVNPAEIKVTVNAPSFVGAGTGANLKNGELHFSAIRIA